MPLVPIVPPPNDVVIFLYDADGGVERTRPDGGDMELARQLAAKELPRLRRLGPLAGRRRLAGMLYRRGFDYEQIAVVVSEALGTVDED